MHIQNREEYLIDFPLAHGPFGNDGDFSFYPRVDNEIFPGNIGHTLYDRIDVGAFEIQGGTGRKSL
jgi:hypothetical protein